VFNLKIKKGLISVYLVFLLITTGFIGIMVFEGLIDEGGGDATTTRYVGGSGPGNYTKIQDAINNATSGDTIRVYSGTYYENVLVNKTISLIGNGSANTTIDGSAKGYAIKVVSNWVNITGLTFTNGGINQLESGIIIDNPENCKIENCNASNNNYFGIYVYYSTNCSIFNTICNSNTHSGIRSYVASNLKIENNICYNNKHSGIIITNSIVDNVVKNNTCNSNVKYGIFLSFSSYNLIENNICNFNTNVGIYIYSCSKNIIENNSCNSGDGIQIWYSSNNIVKNNSCNSNSFGILIISSPDNIIINNICNSNSFDGIRLSFSSGNYIKNNTIISNHDEGIDIMESSSCNISRNKCNFNTNEGILISNSDNVFLSDNTVLNNSIGIHLFNSNNNYIINTSILNSKTYDIKLDSDSDAVVLNSSLNFSKVQYVDSNSYLEVQWFMHIYVINESGYPVSDANVTIKDKNSNIVFSNSTDSTGKLNWIILTEYIEDKSGKTKTYNPYNVSVIKAKYEETFASPEPNMTKSKIIKIILPYDITPPDPPSNLIFTNIGGNFINFSWSQLNKKDVAGYNIYINDSGSSTNYHLLDSTINSYYNATNLIEETIYYFKIKSYDDVPLESVPLSDFITTLDITPPSPPSSLICSKIDGKFINLSWIGSISSDVMGYQIFKNDTGSSVNFHYLAKTSDLFFNCTGLNEETTYYFKVRTFDEVPLFSTFTNIAQATTKDITNPAPPTSLVFINIGGTFINISWTQSISSDTVGYQVYINDTGSSTSFHLIDNTSNLFYNLTGLPEETIYYFKIRAYDEVPLYSVFSNQIWSTTLDITPPIAPTSLICSQIGGKFINITWTASSSLDIEGYEIFINDTGSSVNYHYLADTTNCYFNHTNLYEETTYYYKIKAFDEVPLFSVFSNLVTATTLDITLPLPPTSFTCAKIGGRFIELSWTNSISADVDGYEIYVNDTGSSINFHYLATTSSTNCYFNTTGLVEETTYYYEIRAYDEVPLFSSFSNPVSAITLDITPPNAPKGLQAIALSGTEISISWNSNTESDLLGYLIFMNETDNGPMGSFKLIHTIYGTDTSFKVTGLSEEITYYFKIKAFDEVPNNSTFSDIVSVTTLDETPPAAPTGLSVSNLTSQSLKITWESNSEPDVIGYKLYRSLSPTASFVEINSELINDTQFIDTNLKEATKYYYKIKAVDDAFLQSELSELAYGITLLDQKPPEINNSIEDFEIMEDSYDDTSINLLYWFKDINNDELTFRCEGQKNINVIIHQKNGTVILIPQKDWNGHETLTFYADDGLFEAIFDTITITVISVNDPPDIPEIIKPKNDTKINEHEAIDFIGECNDPDLPYGDVLIFTWSSDIIGKIGNGENLNDIIIPTGKHKITLEVCDKEGETTINFIYISILKKPKIDNDGDLIDDSWESKYGLNPEDPNDVNEDPDNDTLSNIDEFQFGTNPRKNDTDSDGITDGDEINIYHTNATNPDTDGDGILDKEDEFPLDNTKWKKEDETIPDTKKPGKGGHEDSIWIILGAIIILILILAIILFLFMKNKKNKKGLMFLHFSILEFFITSELGILGFIFL